MNCWDVTGADEYHERVNNDFYTNFMAREALSALRGAMDYLADHYPDRLEKLLDKLDFRADLPGILDFEARLYLLLQIRTASLSSNMTATSAWRTSP